jgi:hypothetical protein
LIIGLVSLVIGGSTLAYFSDTNPIIKTLDNILVFIFYFLHIFITNKLEDKRFKLNMS